jgi:general secretion pathway protein L
MAENTVSLLRIQCSLKAGPPHCSWALSEAGLKPVHGEGTLADLPRRAARVQVVVPAVEVLLARVNLPHGAKRRAGPVLTFAVEDQTLGEPEAHHASWLGSAGDADVLAVVDKKGVDRWREALAAAGINDYEVQCETLLLPRAAGEWSLAWDGREGFLRSGEFEGAATDSGAPQSPPLTLRLMVDAAAANDARPAAIAIYATGAAGSPDIAAWQRELGTPVRFAGTWDWRNARPEAGVNLMQQRRGWRLSGDLAARLRPAAWIAGVALALHAVALLTDWTLLRSEQRALRQQMEARFRAAVPDAVAVVDPALQMRRKLADARHVAGVADGSDFLPMIETAAAALKELPAGSLRVASYEQGRLSLELAGIDEMAARRFVTRLQQGGANVDAAIAPVRSGNGAFIVTVRSS